MGVPKRNQFDWSEGRIKYLRDWWGKSGVSASLIAAKLGCTRNAVVGKAHRLGLPDLGNPVGMGWHQNREPKPRDPYQRRDETGAKKVTGVPRGGVRTAPAKVPAAPKPKRTFALNPLNRGAPASLRAAPSLPVAPSVQPADNPNRERVPQVPARDADTGMPPISQSVPAGRAEFRALVAVDRSRCVWIEGATPRNHADAALTCGEPVVPGRPYCLHHCERAAGKGTPSEQRAAEGIGAAA